MSEVKVSVSYLGKVAEYIKASQETIAELEKQSSVKNWLLREKVASAVDIMIEKGYAASDERNSLVGAFTSYPEKLAEALNKVMRSTSSIPSLGSPVDGPNPSGFDAITQFALDSPTLLNRRD